ncbi:expressed unknown protein [Seminavis robusta]|uniref:Uncharacterized protein n=1 Tax=Seminavis robusta TaxID=568900 RepID=A0A9N8DZE8_9STRA|nr:expressed unknown protein [Seminavis robusta]|eukprot:Sro499_g155070.1 n/a (337) ;mRNA; f:31244-32254
MSKRGSLKMKVGNVFKRGGKKKERCNSDTESSESSMDLDELRQHIGELSLTFKDSNSAVNERKSQDVNRSITLNTSTGNSSLVQEFNNSSSNDDRMKNLILSYKSKPRPFRDTKAPPRPHKSRSFKMDGVPAFMNQEIQKNARREAEKRRKRQQAKSATPMSELHESMASMSMPTMTRKERPKVRFLNLPKDHPLYWDHTKLSASDFPEEDRAFLAKTLKNPMKSLGGQASPARADIILKKLHLKDWDAATIGRSAMALFHPDSNPLNLSPEVTNYFFTRFNTLKTGLDEGDEIQYMDRTYQQREGTLPELYSRLRGDFEEATRSYEIHQNSPYDF